MTTRVKIYQAANDQFAYKIYRGSNIIVTPHETYATRENCRRALRTLAAVSSINPGEGDATRDTELSFAVNGELKREALEHARETNRRKLAADIERTRAKPLKLPADFGGWPSPGAA